MIIKRLILKNFGSYFKRTEIVFPESGFFLISGPTGAGKTTILEAICFALFGKIPRYDKNPNQIYYSILSRNESLKKSRFLETEVTVEILLDKIYYITRSLNFIVKDGEIKLKSSSVELRTEKETLAVRPKEYEEKICKILGIEKINEAYESFTKSIFLPQNAFDKFLYLTPREREKLILELLNLTIYEKIKEKIKEEYNKLKNQIDFLKNQIEIKRQELEEKLKQIDTQNIDQIEKLYEIINSSVFIINNLLQQEQNIFQEIENNVLNAQKIITTITLIPVNQELIDRLAIFHNSLSYVFNHLYTIFTKIQQEKINIQNTNFDLYTLIENLVQKFKENNLYYAILELISKIKEMINIENQQEKLQKNILELQESLAKKQIILNDLKETKNQKQKLLQTTKEKIVEIESIITKEKEKLNIKQFVLEIQRIINEKNLEKCLVCSSILNENHYHFIKTSLQKGDRKIIQKLEENQKKLEELKTQKSGLEEELLNIDRKIAQLESKEKIEKTELNRFKENLKELNISKQNIQNFINSKTDLINHLSQIYQRIYKHQEKDLTVLEKFKNLLEEFQNLKKLIDLIQQYSDINFETLEVNLLKQTDIINQNENFSFLTNLIEQIYFLKKVIKLIKDAFAENYHKKIEEIVFNKKFVQIHEEINLNLKKLSSLIEQLRKEQNNFNLLKEEKLKIEKSLEKLLSIENYLFKNHLLSANFMNTLYNLDTYLNILKNLNIELQKIDTSETHKILEILDKIQKSQKILKQDLLSYLNSLKETRQNMEQILQNYRDSLQLKKEIQQKEEEINKLSQEFEIIRILKEDFEGPKGDFISFVFNFVFDIIKEKANQILSDLTEGRYYINFSKQKEEIEVIDNWYSVERNVRSLSGGEKFLTSLAIAMSISELMSTSKYKVKSMFIDEGFGTLDNNTLNDVIDYLENYFYNYSDKVLGIITHVEEIKERFNYVIKVKKGREGSEVEILSKI